MVAVNMNILAIGLNKLVNQTYIQDFYAKLKPGQFQEARLFVSLQYLKGKKQKQSNIKWQISQSRKETISDRTKGCFYRTRRLFIITWSDFKQVKEYCFTDILYEKKYHGELEGGVARVTINRPQKLNALTDHAINEMFQAFYDASHDLSIGVIVLTSFGNKAFCAGGDLEWEKKGLKDMIYQGKSPAHILRMSRKPVLSAVKGYCLGLGSLLSYFSDFTIAADNAVFAQAGPTVGSPVDGFLVAYLVRVVGAKKARELFMLCRRYTAQEALEMKLINMVVPLERIDQEVDRWCAEILALSPGCLEVLKASFDMEIDYMAGSLGRLSGLMYPDWFTDLEIKEGQQAFFEKRKPRFWKSRIKKL